jgi:hypothetical protein
VESKKYVFVSKIKKGAKGEGGDVFKLFIFSFFTIPQKIVQKKVFIIISSLSLCSLYV